MAQQSKSTAARVLSVAVANETTNHYVSFECELNYALDSPRDLTNDDRINFTGPYLLVAEVATYLPHEDSLNIERIDPDDEVIVYDMYGPHGVHSLGKGYESTAEVREWIDTTLESDAPGEYAIGYVARDV